MKHLLYNSIGINKKSHIIKWEYGPDVVVLVRRCWGDVSDRVLTSHALVQYFLL